MVKIMRKLLCVLLLVLLVFSATSSFGEEIDLTGMTLDELAFLQTQIREEINKRIDSDVFTITPGIYIGGEAVQPGGYIITCIDPEDEYIWIEYYSKDAMAIMEWAKRQN